jgi:hypothetical protein
MHETFPESAPHVKENRDKVQHNTSMATVLPPPTKRQRVEASEKVRVQAEANEIPNGLGSVRVQFVDQSTGSAAGPAVAVSIENTTVKNLETLLNSIQGNVGSLSSHGDLSVLSCQRTLMKEYPIVSPSNPPHQISKMTRPWSMLSQIFTARSLSQA